MPPWYVVTVTLETDCFFGAVALIAAGAAFLAGALRVLVLRALGAAVDLETVAVGIREKRVYSLIIHNKKPLDGVSLQTVVKKSSLSTVLSQPSCILHQRPQTN